MTCQEQNKSVSVKLKRLNGDPGSGRAAAALPNVEVERGYRNATP